MPTVRFVGCGIDFIIVASPVSVADFSSVPLMQCFGMLVLGLMFSSDVV